MSDIGFRTWITTQIEDTLEQLEHHSLGTPSHHQLVGYLKALHTVDAKCNPTVTHNPKHVVFPKDSPNPEMIRIARDVRMLTQVELAQQSGISQPDLSRYEGGIKPIPEAAIKKLAEALGFPVSFFYQVPTRGHTVFCFKNLRAMRS